MKRLQIWFNGFLQVSASETNCKMCCKLLCFIYINQQRNEASNPVCDSRWKKHGRSEISRGTWISHSNALIIIVCKRLADRQNQNNTKFRNKRMTNRRRKTRKDRDEVWSCESIFGRKAKDRRSIAINRQIWWTGKVHGQWQFNF